MHILVYYMATQVTKINMFSIVIQYNINILYIVPTTYVPISL